MGRCYLLVVVKFLILAAGQNRDGRIMCVVRR